MGETVQVIEDWPAQGADWAILPTRAYVERVLRERAEAHLKSEWMELFDLSQVLERAAWVVVQEFFRGTDQ